MKRTFKWFVRSFASFVVLPLVLQTWARGVLVGRDRAFQMASQELSLFPGIVGNYLRAAFYRRTLPRCGADVCIEFGTLLHQPTIELGRRVYIGSHCSIGECVIEDDVLLGSNVDVISGGHQHSFGDLTTPIRDQDGYLTKIVIGADSWIGNSAVVMANIGCQCVVAAGSVVYRDTEPRSIVGGNPASLIRKR